MIPSKSSKQGWGDGIDENNTCFWLTFHNFTGTPNGKGWQEADAEVFFKMLLAVFHMIQKINMD
jgi:hypothetical protein